MSTVRKTTCFAAAIAALLLAGCGHPEADSDSSQAEDSNGELPAVVQGTAEEVQHGFADNGDFGQEANVSHQVLVTGTIGEVRKTIDDNPYITFRISGNTAGPLAMFSKTNPPKHGRLAVGNKIKVLCPSLHLVDASAVLEDCVLQ